MQIPGQQRPGTIASFVSDAILRARKSTVCLILVKVLPKKALKSFTTDRGKEFACYKEVEKYAPYICQYMVKRLKDDLLKDGITLNVKYYGESTDFKCDGGKNIGKLTKEELLELYNNSDFGMVR